MLKLEGIDVEPAVCVEMNPLTALRLAVNLNTNFGFSAVAINAAVCNMPEGSEIRLKPSRGGTSESMFSGQVGREVPAVVVRTTTFTSLYSRYFADSVVDICKIDIEAAEYEVIDSIADDVLKKIRYLFIEFHDRPRTPAVIERLLSLGFTELTLEEDRSAKAIWKCECSAARRPDSVSAQIVYGRIPDASGHLLRQTRRAQEERSLPQPAMGNAG